MLLALLTAHSWPWTPAVPARIHQGPSPGSRPRRLAVHAAAAWSTLSGRRTVFTLLYMLLEHGHETPQRAARWDPPTNVFRLRLVCQVGPCLPRTQPAAALSAAGRAPQGHTWPALTSPSTACTSRSTRLMRQRPTLCLTCSACQRGQARLAAQALEVCGQYFCKGQSAKRLDRFLAFLHRYVLAKASLPLDIDLDVQVRLVPTLARCHSPQLASGASCPARPVEADQAHACRPMAAAEPGHGAHWHLSRWPCMQEMLDRLRPQQVRPETYAEADKAVADLLAAEAREAALGTTPEDASDEEQDDDAGSAGPSGPLWPVLGLECWLDVASPAGTPVRHVLAS